MLLDKYTQINQFKQDDLERLKEDLVLQQDKLKKYFSIEKCKTYRMVKC